jgi:hypothetical protein
MDLIKRGKIISRLQRSVRFFLPFPGALPLAITSHAVGVKTAPLLTLGLYLHSDQDRFRKLSLREGPATKYITACPMATIPT